LYSTDAPIFKYRQYIKQMDCCPYVEGVSISAVGCKELNHCREIKAKCLSAFDDCKDRTYVSSGKWPMIVEFGGDDGRSRCTVISFEDPIPLNGVSECRVGDLTTRWMFFTSMDSIICRYFLKLSV
jgi:hypothetical protein